VLHSSTQQAYIQASPVTVWELVGDPNHHPDWWPEMLETDCADLEEGCRYRGVVKGPFGADEHEMLIEQLDNCDEISIHCEGTGVTTRFRLTEAQDGTFVEGNFSIEPHSLGMKVVGTLYGRRYLRSWLNRSLGNLKQAAEQTPASP
jgi:uncharacterized protein YndB with AHSA1/START domain